MLRPEQITQELFEFNRRIANGMTTLGKIGRVDVEASPKDPVYREDKLVLYRYRPRREQVSTWRTTSTGTYAGVSISSANSTTCPASTCSGSAKAAP